MKSEKIVDPLTGAKYELLSDPAMEAFRKYLRDGTDFTSAFRKEARRRRKAIVLAARRLAARRLAH